MPNEAALLEVLRKIVKPMPAHRSTRTPVMRATTQADRERVARASAGNIVPSTGQERGDPIETPQTKIQDILNFAIDPGNWNPVGPAQATMSIPLERLIERLTSRGSQGADALIAKSPSRLLKELISKFSMGGGPEGRVGSYTPAQVASGVVPDELIHTGTGPKLGGGEGVPGWEKVVAQKELYRITQQMLDDLGIPAGESVIAHRGGPLYTPGYRLTPTSVDRGISKGFARSFDADEYRKTRKMHLTDLESYEVPRTSIRALAGILSRGDDTSLSEMLIPSATLAKGKVGDAIIPTLESDPSLIRSIPSKLRREIARLSKGK